MHRKFGPVFVSPRWVLESWSNGSLKDPIKYAPLYGKVVEKSKPVEKAAKASSAQLSPVFKGCVFALLRVAPPPGAVDFDSKELERSIRAHSGQILSLKVVDALKVDRHDGGSGNRRRSKRKCYVVSWGGYTAAHLEMHPLVAQIKRHELCTVHLVTPIWLFTCVTERRAVTPTRVPDLFVPSLRPLHSLQLKEKSSTNASAPLRISITGFSGSQRTGLGHLIDALGAAFDDSMRTSTTHLVCGKADGQKYEKALQWKLKIVSVEWLYHVAKFGYSGENGKDGAGCEARFPVDAMDPTAEEGAGDS